MKKLLVVTLLALAACAKSNGPCGNCDVYPHPNGVQKAEVESQCQHSGLSFDSGALAQVYTCKQFNPVCTVTIQDAPINQPLQIASTCPSFP